MSTITTRFGPLVIAATVAWIVVVIVAAAATWLIWGIGG